MTDICIYFSDKAAVTVTVIINGERESYTASNIVVDFKRNIIKFDTKIFERRIEFNNIAMVHTIKEHITIKEYDED